MGGASGYLRQEFRELEILDEITKLKYSGLLPGHIEGHRRNTLVRAYQHWKKNECPRHVHPAIKWSKQDPLNLLDYVEDAAWKIVKKNNTKTQSIIGSILLNNPTSNINKHNVPQPTGRSGSCPKPHDSPSQPGTIPRLPIGFIWSSTYSCAYDALFTIIYNMWTENQKKWTENL
ncbi:hypothetical protein NEOLEDRAFT_1057505, partial [Neolentinus lepideus HHB14362 ss-1]